MDSEGPELEQCKIRFVTARPFRMHRWDDLNTASSWIAEAGIV